MSIYWWLIAVVLVLGSTFAQVKGAALIQRLTGRDSRPPWGVGLSAELYSLLYFGLAFAIGLPPIYLMPDADPLVNCFFWFLGITVGSLVAQAFFGRKLA